MANLTEIAQWEAGVYQLDTSDPVLGGPDGVDNRQAQQLANRTAYLKDKIEDLNGPNDLVGLDGDGHLYLDTNDLEDEKRIGFKEIGNNWVYFSASALRFGIYSQYGALLNYNLASDYITSDKHIYLDTYGTYEKRLGFRESETDYSYFFSLPDRVGVTTPEGLLIEAGRANEIVTTGFMCDWMPVGSVLLFAGASPPESFLELNGAALNRADFPRLWAFAQASGRLVTESAWQADPLKAGSFSDGNGSTTFRLPDFRGQFPRFWDHDSGRDPDQNRLGLIQAQEIQSHSHNAPTSASGSAGTYAVPHNEYITYDYISAAPTSATGGTETRPHNVVLMPIIRWR